MVVMKLSHGYLSCSLTCFFPSSSLSLPILFPFSLYHSSFSSPTVCWWEWASSETGISESTKLCPLCYLLWRIGRSLSQTFRNGRSKCNIRKVVRSTAVHSVKTTWVIASIGVTYAEWKYLVSFPDPTLSWAGHVTITVQCGASVSKLCL